MQVNSWTSTTLARGIVGAPVVSGDGSTVVWNQNVDGNTDVYRWRDGVTERLSSDPRQDIHPSCSFDGSVVTWSRFSTLDPDDASGNFDVVVHRDGQESVLADGPGNQTDPQVSSDGQRFTWTDDGDGKDRFYRVVLHEDGKARALTPPVSWNMHPMFSGDGQSMFWTRFTNSGSDLIKRDGDGRQSQITNDPQQEVRPCVTADGSTVFFTRQSLQGDDDLFRLQLPAKEAQPVSALKGVDESWPACSQDGSQVAWSNFDRRGGGDNADSQVFLSGPEGTGAVTEGPGMHSNVSMSGDGTRLAYQWVDQDDINKREVVLLQRAR